MSDVNADGDQTGLAAASQLVAEHAAGTELLRCACAVCKLPIQFRTKMLLNQQLQQPFECEFQPLCKCLLQLVTLLVTCSS